MIRLRTWCRYHGRQRRKYVRPQLHPARLKMVAHQTAAQSDVKVLLVSDVIGRESLTGISGYVFGKIGIPEMKNSNI